MKHFVLLISSFCMLFGCLSKQKLDSHTKQQVKAITSSIDSNSIKVFYEWNYVTRDTYHFWTRIRNGEDFYSCTFQKFGKTSILRIFEPRKFIIDFPCTYNFDTLNFFLFSFYNENENVYKISSLWSPSKKVSSDSLELIIDTSIQVKKLFTSTNPFYKLDSLSLLINKLGILGISYQPNIGNFIEFQISPQYKLTYLPDNLYLNPSSGKYWKNSFENGQSIDKNWKLINLYK